MAAATGRTVEERLQAIEDQLEISRLIAGYGYAVDGLNTESVRDCYTEDGVYAITGFGTYEGRESITDITKNDLHLGLVNSGCAHASTFPYIVIDGNKAVATCHTMVLTHNEGNFTVWRLSASRINLSRQSDSGWKITHRETSLLDGKSGGAELLARLKEGPDKSRH